jgi:predicted RNase H-like HicB family nuclease
MAEPIVVSTTWDPESKVWVAESDQVPGLATGADTLEELVEKLKVAIPELLAENRRQSAIQDRGGALRIGKVAPSLHQPHCHCPA